MMPFTPPPLKLGTRGSKLALLQAKIAACALKEKAGLLCEIVAIRTAGDKIAGPLADAGGKALFARELEAALFAGRIDVAVHSAKDLAAEIPAGLILAAILPRETPFDGLVLPAGTNFLKDAPRIGTASVRRAALCRRIFPGVEILPLRGNVDTRLAKLDAGAFDATVMALAGLKRLGLEARASRVLPPAEWLPALSQGAIAIETRAADAPRFAVLNHAPSALAVFCERAFQAGLGGSCRSPIAGLAEISGRSLRFRGEVLAPDGSDAVAVAFEVALTGDYAADLAAVAARGLATGKTIRPQATPWL
jgi:hydroxymethylbilane synthase